MDLPGGIFGFRFFYAGYGYATCADSITITISQPTFASINASYKGGVFDITGSGLSTSATLDFAGFKTTLSNVTTTSAVATIPPLVNSISQPNYTLTTPIRLNSSHFTIIADTDSSKSLAFDAVHGTRYISSQTSCYIGIDVGPELLLNLTRIRFFPNNYWLIVADYMMGATLEASVDGVNYDVIATIDSTVHTGWNFHPFVLTTYYRYVRFVHTSVSKCQLAEI